MTTNHKFIGLDVHKDTIVIAIAEGGRGGEVRDYGTISHDLHALDGARSAEKNAGAPPTPNHHHCHVTLPYPSRVDSGAVNVGSRPGGD